MNFVGFQNLPRNLIGSTSRKTHRRSPSRRVSHFFRHPSTSRTPTFCRRDRLVELQQVGPLEGPTCSPFGWASFNKCSSNRKITSSYSASHFSSFFFSRVSSRSVPRLAKSHRRTPPFLLFGLLVARLAPTVALLALHCWSGGHCTSMPP